MCTLFFGLILICLYDYRYGRIPNKLLGLLFIAGICMRVAGGGVWEVVTYIARGLVTGAAFYPVYKIGALGAGDVKLLAMLGSLVGTEHIIGLMAAAMVNGAVIGGVKLLLFWDQMFSPIIEDIYFNNIL